MSNIVYEEGYEEGYAAGRRSMNDEIDRLRAIELGVHRLSGALGSERRKAEAIAHLLKLIRHKR